MTRRRAGGAAVAFAVALLAAGAAPALAKRAGPAPVAPVVMGAVRFEAPPWARVAGADQNGGVVVARDASSGAQLWAAKVYTVTYDANLEGDVQDVFIVGLQPSPDGRSLLVTDERGRHWRLDLASHVAAPAAGP